MPQCNHLGRSKIGRVFFILVMGVAQTATAQGEPNTQVLVMLPFASGIGFVGRDEVRPRTTPGGTVVGADGQVRTTPSITIAPDPVDHVQYAWLGLSIGHDWSRIVRGELYGALIATDEMRPRGLIGLRAGPLLPLLGRMSANGTGVAMRFVAMGGIAYRTQMYEWVHASDWRGQRSLALTVTPALEGTYYTSPSHGWTVRLKPEFSYVIDQMGSPIWDDTEMGTWWDAYRWGVTGGIEFGVVF